MVILGELSENREQFLDDMLLFELLRKCTKFGSAYTSDHGRVLLTQFHELLSEALFLGVGPRVGLIEEGAG